MHNTYFTLPVLFVMISNHYAMTYGARYNWLVLIAMSFAGACIRAWFVARHKPEQRRGYDGAAAGRCSACWRWRRRARAGAGALERGSAAVPAADAAGGRADSHACERSSSSAASRATPTTPDASRASLRPRTALVLQSIWISWWRICRKCSSSSTMRTMPLGNLTGMTEEERATAVDVDRTRGNHDARHMRNYPRDLIGYGRRPPHPRWPGDARLALQFVLNYEEGAENCVLDGDPASEVFLSEIIGAQAFPMRHMSMESLYEYGSRAGLWRVLRAFERQRLPLTIFAVAAAVRRNPEAAAAFKELGHEIACHGLRWISYQQVDEATERAHMAEAIAILRDTFGSAPLGWYTGRDSPQHPPPGGRAWRLPVRLGLVRR